MFSVAVQYAARAREQWVVAWVQLRRVLVVYMQDFFFRNTGI